MSTLLKLDTLCKAFGAIKVAYDLSYAVRRGDALGVIGPNGAGKTSMFNLITGTMRPNSGSLTFDGRNVTGWNAARRRHAGIAQSFQVPQPFSSMTVFENAMITATKSAGLAGREAERLCLEVLAIIGANEAGKTTVIRSITGLSYSGPGQIGYGGQDISRLRADWVAGVGRAMMPKGRQLFSSLTVRENLMIGA